MVRTAKAAVFCILCHLVGRYNANESPLQVFAKPKDIKQLFTEVGKTYYVSAGTAKQGPYLHPIYDFHCGEVTVKTITPTMIIQRRFLYYAKESWHCSGRKYASSMDGQYLRSFVPTIKQVTASPGTSGNLSVAEQHQHFAQR
uniref:Putative salivary lipocalin n=1 Tax=Ixodes ricinus TaxID=34613 RepID=A0A6B0UV30_IXORI